jgi:pimeloyl-ACP methyl ester carboxylesterase
LVRSYHVIGISRRGFGASSSPTSGYSADRLGADVIGVLDAERLQRPLLVGNGFAGEELSWVGTHAPQRVAGVVYLDAAYNRTNIGTEGAIARRIPPRVPQPDDLASAESMTRWASAGIGFPIPESEVRQMGRFGPDGRLIGERTPASVRQQILAGIAATDYARIGVPVLAIYAKPKSLEAFPGCNATDATIRQACGELFDWTLRHIAESERVFRGSPAPVRVVELLGAHAFVFLSNPREVVTELDTFASGLPR